VPGVVEGLSRIFVPDRMPGLVEVEVADDLAISTARALIRRGFPVGPSSGLNYAAAVEAASRLGRDAHVVTVFPDRMERYFSTELMRRPGTMAAGPSTASVPPPR
jgi:cysteine synthase A